MLCATVLMCAARAFRPVPCSALFSVVYVHQSYSVLFFYFISVVNAALENGIPHTHNILGKQMCLFFAGRLRRFTFLSSHNYFCYYDDSYCL